MFQWALCSCYTTTSSRMCQARGQRVREIKVWALEEFGLAHFLQEMLTYKSNHIRAPRSTWYDNCRRNNTEPWGCSRIFSIARSRRSLALKLNHFLVFEKNFQIHRKEKKKNFWITSWLVDKFKARYSSYLVEDLLVTFLRWKHLGLMSGRCL